MLLTVSTLLLKVKATVGTDRISCLSRHKGHGDEAFCSGTVRTPDHGRVEDHGVVCQHQTTRTRVRVGGGGGRWGGGGSADCVGVWRANTLKTRVCVSHIVGSIVYPIILQLLFNT